MASLERDYRVRESVGGSTSGYAEDLSEQIDRLGIGRE